jgi:hypothetical protein
MSPKKAEKEEVPCLTSLLLCMYITIFEIFHEKSSSASGSGSETLNAKNGNSVQIFMEMLDLYPDPYLLKMVL